MSINKFICLFLYLIVLLLLEIIPQSVVHGAGIVELKILEWIPNKAGLDCCKNSEKLHSPHCSCHYNFRLCIGLRRTDCAFIDYNFNIFNEIPLGAQPLLEIIKFTPAWKNTIVTATVQIRHDTSRRTLFYLQEPVEIIPLDKKPTILYREFYDSKLSFSLKVKCAENFFGPDCGIFCPRPTLKDNYMCTSHGMVCKKGWQGPKCQDPICEHGCENGKCIAPNLCSCHDGWRGPNCSQCIPYGGCQNGYCVQPNTCICHENWGGKLCDKMLDRCLEKPCKNGASCTTNGKHNYYECKCTEGFAGENCTIPIPSLPYKSCANNPCGIHGACYPTGLRPIDFYCQCAEGYFGPRCENLVIRHEGDIFGQISSCQAENGEAYRNGQSWTTLDCQKCTCLGGLTHCTQAKCEPRNCIASKTQEKSISCPENQICFTSSKIDCLKGKCDNPNGFCKPKGHNMVPDEAQKCRKNSKIDEQNLNLSHNVRQCGKMYLKMDLEKVPMSSTVEDLCYHILLTILAENLENYGFDCHRVTKYSDLIEVDIVSILSGLSVDRVELFIKNKISYNLTSSPILHAVKNVWLQNEEPEKIQKEDHKNGEILTEVKSTNILVIVCILLLALLILIFCSSQLPDSGYFHCIKRKTSTNQNRQEIGRNLRNRPIIRQNLKNSHENGLTGSIFSVASRTPSLSLEHEIAQNLVNTLRQNCHLIQKPAPPSPPPAYDFVENKTSRERTTSNSSFCTEIEMDIRTKSSPESEEPYQAVVVSSYKNLNEKYISVV
uniref:Delta-like protein n=1 Tax=Acrobeloides nanus TaxID=290746 RepID=A0A914C0H3_9BILA